MLNPALMMMLGSMNPQALAQLGATAGIQPPDPVQLKALAQGGAAAPPGPEVLDPLPSMPTGQAPAAPAAPVPAPVTPAGVAPAVAPTPALPPKPPLGQLSPLAGVKAPAAPQMSPPPAVSPPGPSQNIQPSSSVLEMLMRANPRMQPQQNAAALPSLLQMLGGRYG